MLVQADALHVPLPDQSVHCVVTSPPYWGLRKYDGDQGDEPLGLEATPERHVERTVLWAREVRRVLRDDGVFWLNYGDCYNSRGTMGPTGPNSLEQKGSMGFIKNGIGDLAQGSLMLMPHRIALALQQDGWIVRQDFIWHKPNPMPESVAGWRFEQKSCKCGKQAVEERIAAKMEETGLDRAHIPGRDFETIPDPGCPDCHGTGKVGEPNLRKSSWRHTRAHEYVFMLVKDMQYWCNQEAVREAVEESTIERNQYAYKGAMGRHVPNENRGYRELPPGESAFVSGRNPRSVANIATAPYSGAHYATFPPNLIAPLIRASCPRWACPECGQGWAPVVERGYKQHRQRGDWEGRLQEADGTNRSAGMSKHGVASVANQIKGYRPTCEHEHTKAEAVPGIVFDPFIGSGTTGMVARELQRRWIGADLSMEYLDQQAKIRTRTGSPSGQLENLPLFDSDAID